MRSFTGPVRGWADSACWYFGGTMPLLNKITVHTYAATGTHAVCLCTRQATQQDQYSAALIEISDATAPVADFGWGDHRRYDLLLTSVARRLPAGSGCSAMVLRAQGQYPTHWLCCVRELFAVCMEAINAGGNDIICQLVDVCVPCAN